MWPTDTPFNERKMMALDDLRAFATDVADGVVVRRPRTPNYLRAFVNDLYGAQCLWCGAQTACGGAPRELANSPRTG